MSESSPATPSAVFDDGRTTTTSPRPERIDVAVWVALALISYLPSFLTRPGEVAADTKQYLYLDPGRLIQSAISMWNPDVGAGTVTHQNIGYLFPMGPYYWLVAELHIPIWIGQRFWMGSLFFAAGMGVWYLGRLLGLSRSGRLAAALAYMLTPYVIDYITRISAIVMPWAALGWMVALTILAVRKGGWRYPAVFAVVIALVGGVNATSILLVGVAPLLWVVFAVWVTHEVAVRAAWAAVVRIGALGLGVSLWWMAGLWAEGAYGVNVLKYTETLPTVSSTSLSSEVLRGLGYWYFYGQDKVGPWTTASFGYLQWTWLIVVSFAVPILCLTMGMVVRWRSRAFAITLIVVGVVLAVGTYPFKDPTPFGALVKAAGSDSTVGLALRSTNRIIPIVLLGLALLLGAGITAVTIRTRRVGLGLLAVSTALIAANLTPLWNGGLVADNLQRPAAIPPYIHDAATYLNSQSHDTRVLQIPGQDFAYYRWGITSDPVWPGLMTRPYLIRAAVPQGEAGTINLLQALDESMQDGVFVPSTLAPVARLLSAGDLLYQSDVQFERFGTTRPQPLWLTLNQPSTGLGAPVTFGTPQLYPTIKYPLTDETQLAIPNQASVPPPVAVFPVPGARPIARTESPVHALVVAGDGQGVVEAAAAGLLASNPTIVYSATFAHDPAGLDRQLSHGSVLVLTDSNRKQHSTWGTVVDNYGYVEQANETPLVPNPAEASLPLFAGAGSNTQTVAVVNGVASVRATAYANPITNTAENQPLNAVDGNPETSWVEGAFSPATGESIEVKLVHPTTADHITLLQPQSGPRNRTVTQATLTFDGGSPVTTTLGALSEVQPGQVVAFPKRTFRTLTITIDDTSAGVRKDYDSQSAVGFADIAIPGVAPATEALRLPTDLLDTTGAASLTHQLDIVVNRIRAQVTPPRADPELSMARQFSLPTTRTFSVGGRARISALAPDTVIDGLVGRTVGTGPPSTTGAATVLSSSSSGRLSGDLRATASAAVDGDPATAWEPGLGSQAGGWVEYQLSHPVTFDHLDLQVVADGKHSIPTSLTVSTPAGSRTVALPQIGDGQGRPQGTVVPVPVAFPAISGSDVRITVDTVAEHNFLDYLSNSQNTDPVALAEVGIPGVAAVTTPAVLPVHCYPNLLAVDGHPVDIEISGTAADALANGGLTIRACGNATQGLTLGAGSHTVTTPSYHTTGLNVDSLTLGSSAGGAALSQTASGQLPAPPSSTSPPVSVLGQSRTSMTVSVKGDGSPFWMVLGQSQSNGWKATTSTGVSLGSSTLIDGYANGWYIPRAMAGGTLVLTITWAPQRVVDVALVISGATLLASLVLIFLPAGFLTTLGRRARRRRRDTLGSSGAAPSGATPSSSPAMASATIPPAGLEDDPGGPARPVFTSVRRSGGTTPPWPVCLLAAAVGGLVTGIIVAPLAGLLIAAFMLAELRIDRARTVVLTTTVGLLGATAGYVALHQYRNGFIANINWPSHAGIANSLVWIALCLVGVDGAVQLIRRRRRGGAAGSADPTVDRPDR